VTLSEETAGKDAPGSGSGKRSTRLLLDISLALLVVFLVSRLLVSGLAQESVMPSVNKAIELFAALSLMFWILGSLAERKFIFLKTGVLIPILIFMVTAVFSMAQASYPFPAAQTAATWVIHLCAFFAVIHLSAERRRFRVILAAVAATAIVVAALALYQYFYEFGMMKEYYRENYYRIAVAEDIRQDMTVRVHMDEAMGTFIQSNIFAGYLVLIVPVLAFAAYGAFRRRREDVLYASVMIAGGALGLTALYLSGSKGGWLALLGGALLFGLFFWLRARPPDKAKRARNNALFVFAAIVILIVTGMLAVGYDGLPASVRVRLGYWDAALRMIWHNPLGVGAANFQENYTVYQQPWATEVRIAHNSFLTIWTELSVIGLAAFVSVMFLAGRRYMRATRGCERDDPETAAPASAAERAFYAAMILAGAAAFVLVAWLSTIASVAFFTARFEMAAIAAALWVALAAVMLLSKGVLDSRFIAPGIALGLLAFSCHAFIDFDFYSHGVNATLWVLLGLLLVKCCRLENLEGAASRATGLGLAAALFVVAIVILFGAVYLPHALVADNRAAAAESLGEKAMISGYDPAFALAAAEEYDKAQKLSHWNAENYQNAGDLYEVVFQKTGVRSYAAKARDSFTGALRLRSRSHHACFHRAFMTCAAEPGSRGALESAIKDIEKAVRLYPINAYYHYALGIHLVRLAEVSGLDEKGRLAARARAEFEEALWLHKVVVYRRGKLPEAQYNDVVRRLGFR
jgi:tetratricopeptide (TPR) repeat protein